MPLSRCGAKASVHTKVRMEMAPSYHWAFQAWMKPEALSRPMTAIMDAAVNPIYVQDPAGHYVSVNRAFANFLGVTIEGAQGLTAREIFSEEIGELLAQKDQEILIRGGVQQLEVMRLWGDCGLLSLRATGAVVEALGLFAGLWIVARSARRVGAVFLVLAAVTLVAWMQCYWIIYNITIAILLVAALAWLAAHPSGARHFGAGIMSSSRPAGAREPSQAWFSGVMTRAW